MVGQKLVERLLELGNEVIVLSRSSRSSNRNLLSYSQWKPDQGEIDESLVNAADAVINLSGASIAQRWTEKTRKEIINSRVSTSSLLSKVAGTKESKVKVFINASAIGFYEPGSDWRHEDDKAGDHFMAKVCKAWEDSVIFPEESKVRKVICRIGVVLDPEGGALKAMSFPFKLGLGAPLGSGKQYMSIIHIDDLIRILVSALENESYRGVYNAVSPECPTNKEFSKSLAKALNRPFFLPPVPAFILRLAFGDTAESILMSFRVSAEKLTTHGFQFTYPDTESSLKALYK